MSPPLLSAGNHIEDRWNTTLNRHQRRYHHQPYTISCCSGHLSKSNALLRCSTSWSSFCYCGCFFNSSSFTPKWHSHRYPGPAVLIWWSLGFTLHPPRPCPNSSSTISLSTICAQLFANLPRCYWSNLSSPPVNNPRDLLFTHQDLVPTSSSNISLSTCRRPTFCKS